MKLHLFVICDTQLKSALPSDLNTLLKTRAQFYTHRLGFAVVAGIRAGSAAAGGAAAQVLALLTGAAACGAGEQHACSPSSLPPVDAEERARRQWTWLTSSEEQYSLLGCLYLLRWLEIWRGFRRRELRHWLSPGDGQSPSPTKWWDVKGSPSWQPWSSPTPAFGSNSHLLRFIS